MFDKLIVNGIQNSLSSMKVCCMPRVAHERLPDKSVSTRVTSVHYVDWQTKEALSWTSQGVFGSRELDVSVMESLIVLRMRGYRVMTNYYDGLKIQNSRGTEHAIRLDMPPDDAKRLIDERIMVYLNHQWRCPCGSNPDKLCIRRRFLTGNRARNRLVSGDAYGATQTIDALIISKPNRMILNRRLVTKLRKILVTDMDVLAASGILAAYGYRYRLGLMPAPRVVRMDGSDDGYRESELGVLPTGYVRSTTIFLDG